MKIRAVVCVAVVVAIAAGGCAESEYEKELRERKARADIMWERIGQLREEADYDREGTANVPALTEGRVISEGDGEADKATPEPDSRELIMLLKGIGVEKPVVSTVKDARTVKPYSQVYVSYEQLEMLRQSARLVVTHEWESSLSEDTYGAYVEISDGQGILIGPGKCFPEPEGEHDHWAHWVNGALCCRCCEDEGVPTPTKLVEITYTKEPVSVEAFGAIWTQGDEGEVFYKDGHGDVWLVYDPSNPPGAGPSRLDQAGKTWSSFW